WTKTLSFEQGENLCFKFTLGRWPDEAINSDGSIPENYNLTVTKDTIITMIIDKWGKYLRQSIKAGDLFSRFGGILLWDYWKYHEGDNLEWAKSGFNDSSWKTVTSNFHWLDPRDLRWKGVGWFRKHLHVDSALWNKTFAMTITQSGPLDIYYNGRLIKSIGRGDTPQAGYIPFLKNSWEEFTFDAKADQVFAVRYENYDAELQQRYNLDSGFGILIFGLNQAFNTAGYIWTYRLFQVVFTVIPFVLSFMHLCLYLFYRRQKQNLYYAICLLGFAGLTYFNYEQSLLHHIYMLVFHGRPLLVYPEILNTLSAATAIFFGMLTLFSISYDKLPKRWLPYLVLYIAVSASGFLYVSWQVVMYIIILQFGFLLAECMLAAFRRNKIKSKGTWIILTGFFVLCIFIALEVLVSFGFIILQTPQLIYVYGMLAFAISMSLYLSYNFAFINKDLEEQLEKVNVLSDKAIEQERIQAALEIERRLMEADDLRKTKELESARDLQLSLLPKKVPATEHLDIACYMKTATEVGGDYYDFHLSEDGVLTAFIGDATGHGLKAGNMVILAKGLFNTLAMEDDLIRIIHSFNRSIKQMNLHLLSMCMSLIRIEGDRLEYVSAGMPPMQIYRKEKGEVEELLLKGMPLGAFNDFPYKKISAHLCHNDVILLMSDGLTEMFNEKKETYGMEKVVDSLKESADKSAQEIIEHIWRQSRLWADETPLADDMTVMVIKIK
ncbi:MAG: SpoIIE family protein phosphatase, partial [Syntrophothermus sp.]